MSFSESNDFQNEKYRFEELDDFIDFEDLAYNDVMRYEGDLGKYELFKAFDSVDKDKERELVEENQSEMQKISSTLCMREEEESDESEDESQFQGTQGNLALQFAGNLEHVILGLYRNRLGRGIGARKNLQDLNDQQCGCRRERLRSGVRKRTSVWKICFKFTKEIGRLLLDFWKGGQFHNVNNTGSV